MVLFCSDLASLHRRFSTIFPRDCQLLDDVAMTKTIDQMVVGHSNRLHARVADRGADKLESALIQVSGQGDRLGGARRHPARSFSDSGSVCNQRTATGRQRSYRILAGSRELLRIDHGGLNF